MAMHSAEMGEVLLDKTHSLGFAEQAHLSQPRQTLQQTAKHGALFHGHTNLNQTWLVGPPGFLFCVVTQVPCSLVAQSREER